MLRHCSDSTQRSHFLAGCGVLTPQAKLQARVGALSKDFIEILTAVSSPRMPGTCQLQHPLGSGRDQSRHQFFGCAS